LANTSEKAKTVSAREESRIGLLTLLSVGIGFAAGFIAFALYHLIGLITNLYYYGNFNFSFASPQFNHLGLLVILLPASGGLIAGVLIKYGSTRIIGHGIPETMESVLLNRSKIEPKVGVLKAVSAAVTIGSGQPFGAEGPIIQTGGAFGSFIGQSVSMTGAERKILLVSGAAAGMAATFGTPIAAILLSIELLLFEFRVKSLVPVAIASAIGAWMHIYLISPQPLFQTPAYDFGGLAALPFYAGLGLVCGVLGSVMSRGLYATEHLFARSKIGQPWLPALGGLAVGVAGLAVPQALGVGYDVITGVLTGQYVVGIVLLILVAKAVAWLLAMGSQTSGGTLAPLFMIGGSMGFLYGSGVVAVSPGLGVVPSVFAVAGMAAVFGTASRAPFTSIIFALEVTKDYQGVIPIIITVVIAELVGEVLMDDSIMTQRLAERGLHVRHIYDYNPLRMISIKTVMSSPALSVESLTPVVELFKVASRNDHPFKTRKRLIVTRDGKPVGAVSREQLFEGAAKADPAMTVFDICNKDIATIPQDEFAYEGLRKMTLHGIHFLAVVDKKGDLVGYLSQGDISRAMRGKIEDETLVEPSKYLHLD
jgi:chloride channel protein, CIC family